MVDIKKNVGGLVAADTQSSAAALDMAVVMQSRMCASVMEAAAHSKLPIAATQGALDAMTASLQNLSASRAGLVTAVRELLRIQAASNLCEVSFGCPDGIPPIGALDEATTGSRVSEPAN